jgi:hypothetical protein
MPREDRQMQMGKNEESILKEDIQSTKEVK